LWEVHFQEMETEYTLPLPEEWERTEIGHQRSEVGGQNETGKSDT